MKIAFIGTRGVPASYSGFETCVEQVGTRMVNSGHEVTVYCRSGHYPDHPSIYRGIRLRYLPAVREKHLETLSHTTLSSMFVKSHAAIVCMGVGNAPVVRALELRGKRCVLNVDGADWQRAKWGRFAKAYLRWCERLAVNSGSILVADARSVQSYYLQQYARQTELIAYGALPPSDRGTHMLDKFALKPESYALFVGRLVPENGAHELLEAVRSSGLNCQTVVVGDAPFEREYIRNLRRTAPAGTVFTGYQFGSSYQQLTAHARVFVLAASVGGTHPVLVEQMAAGNCILARDTPSNREVIGETGVLWNSTSELARCLVSVWSDPALRRRLGDAARERASACYSWDLVTERYLELCRVSQH